MTTKKRPTKRKPKQAAVQSIHLLSHPLSALLHTVRCVAQHEDQLCVLTHDIRNTANVTSEMMEELRKLLEELPSHEYTDDIDALREALSETATPSRTRLRRQKKTKRV